MITLPMKVVITRPRYKTHLITPPLGMGYLSSYLKNKGVECEIIDGLNLDLSNKEIVKRSRHVDVIGISVLSYYFLEAVDLAKRLKKAGKIVVIGGPHASTLPILTLKESKADYVVIGEGEETLFKLIKNIKEGKKKKDIRFDGLISAFNKKPVFAPFIKDLSSLPIPDWTQIDPRTYKKAPHGGIVSNFPVAPIMTTRGCPYECKFCASPHLWKRRLRFRDPQEVIQEITYLVNTLGVKEIHFEDDNFTLKRDHAEAVCKGIIKNKIRVAWCTPNGIRADKVDMKLLKLMKKAGCYSVAFGIESGNDVILKNILKHENLDTIRKAIMMAHKVGLITQGFFIFGLPGETKDTIRETINFAKSVPLDKAQFLLLDIIPGSALWSELRFDKKVNWHIDSFHEVSWLPPTIDKKTLSNAQSLAFREFFFRPKQIFMLMRYFKISQISFALKRIRDFKIFKFS
ncbi:hypothetical protein A3K21_00545 [Candidatus Roizmanbacteria bacterium RIFOXYC1_FULL_38_14]|uniref:Uncharacterized protein n=1 Tax=Candidatus Roizmanbacteria bacterium RIFOXYD1_FULL_38_12 TaxID=1802093 RepID=A0A1F7KZF5_9BACT|nr:MAG: hypothetical protein A3K47_00545 [Candidatus Roizmanbacteria bacterium RIFOXYA2_FULL_38_14]OGK63279.1 MAG: hypothetical protein A3K27_00545 [Candidatus Roizmanbacteria bacterium RIFOXYA1_FULL_37_12]OGK65125.1 MAG: hypothetical protein A3K38_00545 [Candidatus Roizmanbacteria bacterium RIFOXYB1_FULL_40_23]OGK69529.1 MAG: hypothetical protein A3K21_00545 [Candidatus Roizmanbacteria bacterium RIFOXYC1_FULL_38_14]OGK73272.1 MAG: hypothetical protein A3K52_00545 [Candidatus Roizmanbacteria ba